MILENENFIAPILALDVGSKRIGLAFLAIGLKTAVPLAACEKAQGRGESHILALCQERGIHCLLVGLPRSSDNQLTPQCELVFAFCRRLKRRNPKLALRFIDEHLSSVEIEQRFKIGGNLSKKERDSGVIDSFVATLFIEEYINSPGCIFTYALESP